MKTKASRRALLNQIESGQLENDKAKLLDLIKRHSNLSTLGLMSMSGMPIQTISARLSDLQDLGLIYVSDGSGKYSKWSFQPDEDLQKLYTRNRRMEKYLQNKKSLLNNYGDLMSEELKFQLT